MTIGERLKQLRLDHDFTLEEVSKQLNFSRQTLQRYESGVITNIPSDKIEGLAKIYNVSPAYIMGWNEESSSDRLIIKESSSEYNVKTYAAHSIEDLDEEDQKKVIEYIELLKLKRKNK